MDPNATLANLREAITKIDPDWTVAPGSPVADLIESFEALDEWISRGGFLPDAWSWDTV